MTTRLPAYFISHGGGPWPYMPETRALFAKLETSLVDMVRDLGEKPRAIMMISGHWESDCVRIMSSPNPRMEYDYYNFPPHTYEVVYGAPGAPELAQKTLELLEAAGIAAKLDPEYGFDHGAFTPMEIMYPDADVPMFQVSLLNSYDPEKHIAIGEALVSLRDEGVLIVGSGLSFHNLRLFRSPQAHAPSKVFDEWLWEAMAQSPDARRERIVNWEQAPAARICHPREDHLAPLFVSIGAAGSDEAKRIYHDTDLFGGLHASSYQFG